MIDQDNNSFDFFGRKKSKIKSAIPGFSYKPSKKKSSGVGIYNFIGNPVSLGPKKNKFVSHQSYWNENAKHVPIWMQKNDDSRLGGSSKAIKEKKAREKFQRITSPRKRFFTLDSEKVQALESTIEEKLSKRKLPNAKEVAKYKKVRSKKLFYKEPQYKLVPKYKMQGVTKVKLDRSGEVVLDKVTGKPVKVAVIDKKTGKQMMEQVKVGEELVQSGTKLKFQPSAILRKSESIAKGTMKAFDETYGKRERVATQKVRRLVKGGLGAAFGESITQQRFGPAIRGRPSGPSGKYMIEGKPVFEAEYQQYAAQQRAKNRILPSQQQQAPLTVEEATAMQMQSNEQPQQENFASSNVPLTPGEIEATKTMQTPQRGVTSAELKAAQELAQQQDNILNAPSFMKGELKATGGSLLTTTGPQIMDAPNAFKGELRTLNRGDPASIGEVKLGERPQTNPTGDTYLDIELGSNKPVLKKRPSEKWMTGEAL